MSPILEILSPNIVETLSADVEMPIGEILSLIWEILSLIWAIMSPNLLSPEQGEFQLLSQETVGRCTETLTLVVIVARIVYIYFTFFPSPPFFCIYVCVLRATLWPRNAKQLLYYY